MSFISFNENYYRKKIEKFESKLLTDNDIYELQQLLKLLDDLADEGYVNLNDHMERSFSCLTRLHSLLKRAGVSPIPVERKKFSSVSYRSEDFELNEILNSLMAEAKEAQTVSNDYFIKEIYKYSRWIGHEEGTAYIFLLRDTLLPYIYFKSRWDKGLYPWLIGRRFLEQMTGVDNVDG